MIRLGIYRLALALLTLSPLSLLSTPVTPAHAQTVPSQYTAGTRYDLEGRVVGVIGADPDGAGVLGRLSERRTYDGNGWLVRVENGVLSGWQDEGVSPSAWVGFTLLSQVDTLYDVGGRKLRDTVIAGGVVTGVTQYSYDAVDRVVCSAVRMNAAVFGSLPADACALGPTGSQGADRITRTSYDNAGRVQVVQKAVGTPRAQDYATYTYTVNGQQSSVTDANSNRTEYGYDGFDRLVTTRFASKVSINTADPADREEYGYDASGNRTSLRKRDGSVLTYQYDVLNRLTRKVVPERVGLDPGHTRDVYYAYDNRGLQTTARFDALVGEGVVSFYDNVGRIAWTSFAQAGLSKPIAYEYDPDGNRVSIAHSDAARFEYRYNGLGLLVPANLPTCSDLE